MLAVCTVSAPSNSCTCTSRIRLLSVTSCDPWLDVSDITDLYVVSLLLHCIVGE